MPGGDSGQAREIAVFRHNLFKISEPFITLQAQQLARYKPIYLGRLRYGDAPNGAESLALRDLGGWWPLARIGWQMITRRPGPYQRLLADRHPALIHAHFGVEGVYALPLAKRLGVPLVTTFHGFDATLSTAALLSSPAWANYPLFRRQLARQGDLFLCASAFIRDRVLGMGFPDARTRIHYIGVDCQAIQPRDPGEETSTILHVARLVEVKGTQYLIRAFDQLARRSANVELAIIGDGPLKRSLQALVKSLGLGHRVRFLGALPHAQVLAWMRKAAMLVLPSVRTSTGRVEGLGMVMLEAAATGVPVVGSRIGGIPEGIIDGQTGFLAPEKAPDALARRMGDLLDDSAMRLQMGSQARALVEERFDIRRQTEMLEGFYDAVLSMRSTVP
ncbi:MAG: glycosyl transferase [Rhodospirillales bacterium]|nr:glycosyl transferase [Rhodospirillales bacterium]